jgi:hypothetical protein
MRDNKAIRGKHEKARLIAGCYETGLLEQREARFQSWGFASFVFAGGFGLAEGLARPRWY